MLNIFSKQISAFADVPLLACFANSQHPPNKKNLLIPTISKTTTHPPHKQTDTTPHKPIVSRHTLHHLPHTYHSKLITPPLTLKHTAKSTNTLSPTHHHTLQLKSQKSLITQPAKLIDTQLYQKQHHTHHTNKLLPHPQTNHLPTHRDITHLTPTTPKSQHPPKNLPHFHYLTQSNTNHHNFIYKST